MRETESFLRQIEARRRMWRREMAKHAPPPPSAEALRLIERIEKAYAGVTCYRELRLLLGGEAEDEYLSSSTQALLAPLEEREDWHAIPADLLLACQCSLSYIGPHAFRFLIPAFMCAQLRNIPFDTFYPGMSLKDQTIRRAQTYELNEAQRACISDYLCLEVLLECETEARYFMPWEADDYLANYASRMSPREYGNMLIRRFREREVGG